MTYIPYGRQSINQADIAAVVEVLRSDFLTQGPCIPAFEKVISDYCGGAYAVAVNSATSALHMACLALDVGPGDIVWTSSVSFVASANCALYCGAEVDFVDIDPRTYNLGIEPLRAKLVEAAANGTLPKVVIPVHLCGQSCDMQAIAALAEQYGFKVIEDASHAIGGHYQDKPVGDCRYSDVTVFSFHPVKIITTAEGGVATTRHASLAQRMQLLRSHGITRDASLMSKSSDGPWYYQQIDLGFNYRMTDMQAALGVSQMKRLNSFVTRRHQLVNRYNERLAALPVILPWQHPETYSAFHLYVVRLQVRKLGCSHSQVFEAMRAADIGVNLHYIPIYLHPYFARMGFKPGYCPEAEDYYADAISLPLFSDMSEQQQEQVITALEASLGL